jgi:UDP-GlcNAc3NAcA epimerase
MQNKHKLISIVGARPQFIKLAAMHNAIAMDNDLKHVIVHSGQHYDFSMSGQFFDELDIPQPDYNLEIGSGHHIEQMAKCMTGLIDVFIKEKPDVVLVYGDTNTTAAAAICASKCNIALAHIEAGLREWDKTIPEEVNKLLTDAVSDLYFTPTETGRQNLIKEGKSQQVFVTGDISLDLLFHLDERALVNIPVEPYIFMTCHRASNTDNLEHLKEILLAAEQIQIKVIFGMHPRTRKAINLITANWCPSHVSIIEPPGFWQTQAYIKNATFVLTDSGGIIKEAYFHKVPAIIIDKQTEWIETVEEGWNVIAGPNAKRIQEVIQNWVRPEVHSNCLGDGKAGERIVVEIKKYLQ